MKHGNTLIWVCTLLLTLLLLAAGMVKAETSIVCTDYGYRIPSEDKVVVGARTYIRYDGVCRPQSELNQANGNWPYRVYDLGDTYILQRKNHYLELPNTPWLNWHFGFDKVSLDFLYIGSHMRLCGDGCLYLNTTSGSKICGNETETYMEAP
jgi:hypothetical protein